MENGILFEKSAQPRYTTVDFSKTYVFANTGYNSFFDNNCHYVSESQAEYYDKIATKIFHSTIF